MFDAKAISIPADPGIRLEKVNKTNVSFTFREAVGSLLFLATVSRPDISYAISTVSRYLNDHNESHCQAVKRIFKYIKGTVNYGIMLKKN